MTLSLAVIAHVIMRAACVWSASTRAHMHYASATFQDADAVLVTPASGRGKSQICVLRRVKAPQGAHKTFVFTFQKVTYLANDESKPNEFRSLDFPVQETPAAYMQSRGHATKAGLAAARGKYGRNEFDIPLPSLAELLEEHAFAPFFLFQVFCMLLWMLDEYWVYSAFTLLMLCVFETMVCKERLRNLSQLRAMRRPRTQSTHTEERGGKSIIERSGAGDIVSLAKQKSGQSPQRHLERKRRPAAMATRCVRAMCCFYREHALLTRQC